jgi:hypothetical protein
MNIDNKYIETMNEWNNSIAELKYNLGYALTHKEKQGTKAWFWRNVGNLFHRRDWHERGMEQYNPFGDLLESAEK